MASNPNPLLLPKPGVSKGWLYFAAGLVWLGVGIMLIGFASRWLKSVPPLTSRLFLLTGILLATGIYFYGFSRLARKNILRIYAMPGDHICLFAFQQWKSYPLVLFMIALGIYLRIYSPIPKPVLAVLYTGIGGGLSSSSLHYFKQILRPPVSILPEQKGEELLERLPASVLSDEKDVQ